MVRMRVREGMRFGADNRYGPGDVVELPTSVLTAFGDKLEPVGEAAPVVEVAEDETSSPGVSEPKSKRRVKA